MPMLREPLGGVSLRIVLRLEPPACDMFQFQTVAFLVYILDHQYIGTSQRMASMTQPCAPTRSIQER
jgi:hypothetical protein